MTDSAAGRAGGIRIAEHLDVAAKRDRADLPAGTGPVGTAEQFGTEADREGFDPHPVAPRYPVVPQLVNEHEHGQHDQERNDVGPQTAEEFHWFSTARGSGFVVSPGHDHTRFTAGFRIDMAYRIQIIEAGIRQLRQRPFNHGLDIQKAYPAFKESLDGHFVRGIQNCRSASPALQGVAGKPQSREANRDRAARK